MLIKINLLSGLRGIRSWFPNWMKATVTTDSSGRIENPESPWYQLFIELIKIIILETPKPPLVRCMELTGSVYKTFKYCRERNKENNDGFFPHLWPRLQKTKKCAKW